MTSACLCPSSPNYAPTESGIWSSLQQKPKKRKGTLQRSALAAALKLKRKVGKTVSSIAESVDESEKQQKTDEWWDRWSTKLPPVQKARR